MSIASWKEEFYPVRAMHVKDELEALDHSILKWTGLLAENLKRHRIIQESLDLTSPYEFRGFGFGADTCALCCLYLGLQGEHSCPPCPLYRYLKKRCDAGPASPYTKAKSYQGHRPNPKPMIRALKGARRMVLKERAKQQAVGRKTRPRKKS